MTISALPLQKFCAMSSSLSEQHGAGRAAAMSTAFHAVCAGAPDAPAKMSRLTQAEHLEVGSWHKPIDLVFEEGAERIVLDWASATKEHPVTLKLGDCEEKGTLDGAWVRVVSGLRVAYVADIKKSAFTVDGPMTLQLLGYGFAYAFEQDCDAFCTAIFIAETGEWIWGEMVSLSSLKAIQMVAELKAAIQNKPSERNTYATGPHCSGCYARLHCPEFVSQALKSEHLLSPALAGELTEETATQALLTAQAMIDIAEKAKANVKEAARRGLRVAQNGKRYLPVIMPGRESVDMEKLKAGLGAEAARYIKKGAPYDQFRWVKS